MVKIINSSNETLAILQNVVSPIISEGLNREFTFDFQTVIDGDKSQYLTYTNKIEVEDNYFNMIVLKKSRTQDGLFFDIQCEHVSYDLLSANFTAGFTATGLFSAVATTLLSGTGFTVGTVQVTGNETISVNESTNAFQILKQLATLYNGELQFSKYQVNLLTQRGSDRHVQFRYRKNLTNATVNIDARQKTAGVPKISYEVGVAELEYEQGYIADGVSILEHFELGDTVTVIDDDLGLNTQLRIVKHSYDTEQRMQGTVEISNFVDDLADTITNIQTTSVVKDALYNNVSLGPELGFVATRSDNKARAIMNATDGIKIQKGDGAGNWTDAIYLDTSGNGTFSGFVLASQFIGGSIAIGSGNNIFKADSNGIYLGNATFGSAPFRVTMSGSATANNLTLTGGLFNVGTGTNTFQFNTTDGLFLGNTAAASAPFHVNMSGALTVSSGSITGGIIQTSESGARIVIQNNGIKSYNSAGNTNGLVTNTASLTYGDLSFYDNGSETCKLENQTTGNGWTLKPVGTGSLGLGAASLNTDCFGYWGWASTSRIGFFGGTPTTQTTVANQSATTAIDTVLAKLNELIDALQSYNLV